MRTCLHVRILATLAMLSLLFLPLGAVAGQNHPSGYGGGIVSGLVYTSYDNELVPLSWVAITASNAKYNLRTYTNAYGHYRFFLPVGTYNLTAYERGYTPKRVVITVTESQVLFVNFFLHYSTEPPSTRFARR